ncbi:S26 family signal peptidase [Asanoa iriomotensis]|uniref:S26 family signal peptidase n=1 Tax=Asanoa iriomotensis TaxID=234613 RepID=A0ABQ4C147_9ACTN|nr:S26 family signal peptidase [Asanoa iriomotensis]GIF56487.1 S26 family signal peptidase [Asanoa iriomotensis]
MTWLGILWAVAVFAGCVLWWVTNRLRIATINGSSMAPALSDGDRVLVRRVRASTLRRGDVVMVSLVADATRPGANPIRHVVKRVAALPGEPVPDDVPAEGMRVVPRGMLVLLGDNPSQSIDSRDLGYFRLKNVFGVVTRRLR